MPLYWTLQQDVEHGLFDPVLVGDGLLHHEHDHVEEQVAEEHTQRAVPTRDFPAVPLGAE